MAQNEFDEMQNPQSGTSNPGNIPDDFWGDSINWDNVSSPFAGKTVYADDIIAGNLQNVVETPNKETTSFVMNMDDNGIDGKMTVWAGAYQRIVKNKNIFIRENQNDGINMYRHETKWPEFIRPKVILAGHVTVNYNQEQFYPWQLGGADMRIVVCDAAKAQFYAEKYFDEVYYTEITKNDFKQVICVLNEPVAPVQEEFVDAEVVEETPTPEPEGQGANADPQPAQDDNIVQPDDNVQPLNSEQSVDQDPVVLNFQFGEYDDPQNPADEQNDEVDPDAQGDNDDPENPTGESENNTDKKSKGKTVAIAVAAAALLAAGVWFFGGKRSGGNSNGNVTPVVPVDTIPAPVPVDTVPVVDTNNVQPVVNPNKPPKLVRRDPTIWQLGDPKPAHIKRRAIYNGR